MIYFCLNCNESFEVPRFYLERHGFTTPPYERISCCYHCGSTDIIETQPCDICGQAISGEYVYIESEDKNICNGCYQQKTI